MVQVCAGNVVGQHERCAIRQRFRPELLVVAAKSQTVRVGVLATSITANVKVDVDHVCCSLLLLVRRRTPSSNSNVTCCRANFRG